MTSLLVAALGIFLAFAIYIASLNARRATRGDDFLDAGGTLPGWCMIFAGGGVMLAGVGLHDHFLLTALYGLQFSHVALGLVLAALCAVIVQKRLWLAARIARIRSPVELLGAYYGSVTVRIFALVVLFLFAVPFAAGSLAAIGELVATVTGMAGARVQAIWVAAAFLFLSSVIGGWRGVIHAVAAQSFLVLMLMLFVGIFAASTFDKLAFIASHIPAPQGTLADKIPGVVQYSAGVGKDAAAGGVWTTTAILSFGLSLMGLVLSPAFGFLGITSATRSRFAFTQVWMIAGLAGGLLLLLGPFIGGEVAALDPATLAKGGPSYGHLVARFASVDRLAAICLLLLLIASLQIAISFFAAAGANIVTLDLVARYMLPDLTGTGRRLAARITLAVVFAAMALAATFVPQLAAIIGSVTLSLSAQLLPALVGLCWVPWISRSAVITGLIAGSLLVVFTEPPGLVLFEHLFVGLPWGRWPLTVHSAAWGLVFNVGFCLLVSIVTRGGSERDHRQILHNAFKPSLGASSSSGAVRGAKWSLALMWIFLALGPGAILGNDFFSHPVFSDTDVALGVPSLWVWQLVFWFIGVLLVWWIANPGGAATVETGGWHEVDLAPATSTLGRRRAPGWIALLLARLTQRRQ